MRWIGDRVTDYRGFLTYVYVHAPDEFPQEDYLGPDEQMTLEQAFIELRDAFDRIKNRVKDTHKLEILKEFLEISYEAYKRGDDLKGAHVLQEFEGIIWPSYKLPSKYEPEAIERVKRKIF